MSADPTALEPCYISRRKCGCIVAAVVATPDMAADAARFVRDVVRRGEKLEQVTVGYVREHLRLDCPHRCKVCKGRGGVQRQGRKIACPDCGGAGVVLTEVPA